MSSRRQGTRAFELERTLLGLCAVLAALAVGCADEHWVEFRYLTAAPAAVAIDTDRITIPVGLAVGVEVTPYRNGEEIDEEVELFAGRLDVLGVDPTWDDNELVIYGAAPGSTWVDVSFDGRHVGEIPALVIEQR